MGESIAPSGRYTYEHWPALAIPTRTIRLSISDPFEFGTIHEVSFVGGFHSFPPLLIMIESGVVFNQG
jgi:hypothetical protein